jgi:hypothetical protein
VSTAEELEVVLSPTAWLKRVKSKINETVEMTSSQKKKENKYPFLATTVRSISKENTISKR